MRYCPQCGAKPEARLCLVDHTPTLDETAFDADLSDPLIGQVFDERYEIMERIGRGGMGRVYRARQLTIGREVALKVLKQELASDKSVAGRFVREAKVASRLRHPNTIVIHDFGHSTDGLFMALELLTGENLNVRLRRERKLPPSAVATIAAAISRSLAEAHSMGIVHRDLKPANIFVHQVHGGKEIVKVLDFGVAKFIHDVGLSESLSPPVFETARPIILGTVPYMSPEQSKGQPVDARTDLYSLGIIMYEALVGTRPFMGTTPIQTLRMHADHPVPPLPEHVPETLAVLVMRLLAKQQDDRPESAEEVADILETWLSPDTDVGRSATQVPHDEATEPESVKAPAPYAEDFDEGDADDVVPDTGEIVIPRESSMVPGPGWGAFDDGTVSELEANLLRRGPPVGRSVGAGVGAEIEEYDSEKAAHDRHNAGWSWLMLFIIACVLVGGWFLYQLREEPKPVSHQRAEVVIMTDPAGASVRDGISGDELGVTPVIIPAGPKAPAKIVIHRPGYRTIIREIRYPNQPKRVTFDVPMSRTATIVLESQPAGAHVLWVEGSKPLGSTPQTFDVPEQLLDGEQTATFRFTKPGFGVREEELTPEQIRGGHVLKVKLPAREAGSIDPVGP